MLCITPQLCTAPLMRPSFAYFRSTLHAAICGLSLALASCASLPPPTAELNAAQQAVARAEASDADQHAPEVLANARATLLQAQAAMSGGRENEARLFALAAAADADEAHAVSRAAVARQQLSQRREEIAGLRAQLQIEPEIAVEQVWDMPITTRDDVPGDQVLRLQALDADPRLAGLAAYERLQARQALADAAAASSRQRAAFERVAGRRVSVAEHAAHAEAIRREIDRLDRERSDLLVEASRQDAARARQEAERLRIEAQIQLEEAQRLRAAAEAEAAARQQAEDVILDVAGDQTARLAAAREKEAALAREEAELLAGGKLPASTSDARGEVFTLAGDAFASGSATLTAVAAASVNTLATYLQAGGAKVRIEGHTDSQGEAAANQQLSQRRANAVRDALAAAGVPRSRLQAVGRGEEAPVADNTNASGRARNRRVEIIVFGK